MKLFISIILIFLFSYIDITAQDVTTVEAVGEDISDNLDLTAIASIFGECKDLEEFEQKINDPESKISNLDLNNDGYVDYLRVVENSEDDAHLISIQAVIGKDLYQDVATVEVSKDDSGESRVQVVGDVYMYGYDYIIEPFYYRSPVIFVYLWRPHRHIWFSPYYWDYYPSYFSYWSPFTNVVYITHINTYVSPYNSYRHTTMRRSNTCVLLAKDARQNAMEISHPKTSFKDRNEGIKNRTELIEKRESLQKPIIRSTGKKVDENWKKKDPNVKKIEVQKESKEKTPDANKKPIEKGTKQDRDTKIDNPKDIKVRPDTKKEQKTTDPVKKEKVSEPKKVKTTSNSKKSDKKDNPKKETPKRK